MSIPCIEASGRSLPPNWAVRQRELMELMDRAAHRFVDHATRPDGTLIQRSVWTSMDGTDNGYEAFLSFPLAYLLGGGEHLQRLGQREWDAITWQYADYGTVEREFVTGFDWFHHSESYTYLYYLALADPDCHVGRRRAERFARMYTGEDPLAPNWDAERCMIRGPLNGSKGPRFVTRTVDWDYHRPILSGYLAPYEDIEVEGVERSDPLFKVDWTDDAVFGKVLEQINARMTRGDVPLNLSVASMVSHAFLFTGEEKYRQWVLDYLQAWVERRDANGGILPDNIGPSGQVGELIDGKWWGGYYGWRWPHGARNIVEPALVAGSCALLLTGDRSHLELCRSQLDMLWEQRRRIDGRWMVPARHGDGGWFDYRPPDPHFYIHLYYLSGLDEDRARLDEIFPEREGFAAMGPDFGRGKAGHFPPKPWLAFIEGRDADYPERILAATRDTVQRSLDRLDGDDSDPEERHCYHFQRLNPVLPEGMVQMALGTPAAVYNGGLLQSHLFYHDPVRRRPGLPAHVAALVEGLDDGRAQVHLVNTDPVEARPVLVQAGAFGEHRFTGAEVIDGAQVQSMPVGGDLLRVDLGPGAQVRLDLRIERFVNSPAYRVPDYDD